MTEHDCILDNAGRTVADYLRGCLRSAETLRLVSAYFSIYGYELLADALGGVGEVRFLFGDPASVDDPDPGRSTPKSFVLTEAGLVPKHALGQKFLARRCAQWVAGSGVHIRSVSRSNFLHGKMYLADSADDGASVVGSSNFTRSGLGGGERPNLEINLATAGGEIQGELRDWFDELWNDQRLVLDVKRDVLTALGRIGQEYAPDQVYFKTLLELFRDEIDARLDNEERLDDVHLYDSAIWNALYAFQKDGVKSVIGRLRRHDGCILADSVGLGKTYTALAVIKYFEQRNERVLVLCPRKLRENWALYPVANAQLGNPFASDRFGYTLLSHTDLSRDHGVAGSIDLANFNWGAFDLVVIDESHNFRNGEGQRYRRLTEQVIEQGAKTKVLMLSATPVNISLVDLRNQINLMTAGSDDAFRESLGIGSIRNVLGAAQRQFKNWELAQTSGARRDKAELLESLGADFLRLLEAVSISRSRRQIERFYAQEMARIGRFPKRETPRNRYPPTDLEGRLSYREIAARIDAFELSVYRPSAYLTDQNRLRQLAEERKVRNFNQADRERFLIGMIRTNFLKRLESSAHSLTLTLQRTIAKIDDLLERIVRYERGPGSDRAPVDILPDVDEDDEEFLINRARRPYHLGELNLKRWRGDLQRDRRTLEAARVEVAAVTPSRDGKLRDVGQAIRSKAETPTIDQDGGTNRKLLVFTTFKDTAEYLYDNLSGLARELRLHMALVSGDATRTTLGDNDFNAILTNFAPRARSRRPGVDGEIDLLIATDCISEGQNLQDCDMVLNYDIHWNPVRLIQRFGRVDRIGSRNRAVGMVNYWPTADMDAYLRLESRVRARMALADTTASGDEDPFTEEAAQLELTFRDEQLIKLRDEIPDLDDLDDSPAMSDFTLDYFFSQLLQYLEQHRDELEAIPSGAYAVAERGVNSDGGVIFVLRQRNAGAGQQRAASPVHPFYAVFIRNDGHIRFGCANARQVLESFESASAGRSEPIHALCDRFDAETDHGRNMERYHRLLTAVVGHIRQAHDRTQRSGLGIEGSRDFVLPTASESPNSASDFELVTWLVIS